MTTRITHVEDADDNPTVLESQTIAPPGSASKAGRRTAQPVSRPPRGVVAWCITHRWRAIAASILVLMGAAYLLAGG